MRLSFALVTAVLLVVSYVGVNAAEAPAQLKFETKQGVVTFDHAKHVERAKKDCKVCHPGLFEQSAKAPLKFKFPHKPHEDKRVSCGLCHRTGGEAFVSSTAANCAKCHVRAAKKG
jgi:c(7)-type cytochrome triheme protein